MVESTALEMRHTGNRIGGSNPSLSATTSIAKPLSVLSQHEGEAKSDRCQLLQPYSAAWWAQRCTSVLTRSSGEAVWSSMSQLFSQS